MPIDMILVKKGMSVPRKGLLEQGVRHIELESKYRPVLRRNGWTDENSRDLHDSYDYLKTSLAEAIDARALSQHDRANEQASIDEAKAFKRRLDTAFLDLYADRKVEPADFKVVRESGLIGRSSKNLIDYLARIRNTVARYDAALAPYFDGGCAVTALEATLSQLEQAQGIQETNLAALPQETLKVYEAKGRLLNLIEKLNRIARIAFDGQAHIIAEFNKDLILRSRRRRSQSTVEPAGDAPDEAKEETG